jgi:SPP1 family predicted phage head-tail adaptor
MSFHAGDLRHRIRIESFGNVLDSSGDVIQDPNTGEVQRAWGLVSQAWAAKMPLSARELLTAQQLESQVSTRFVIRYRSGLDPSMRVVHDGVNFNIEGIIPDPDSGREWLTLQCSSGQNAG